jgi:GxxExxY protein
MATESTEKHGKRVLEEEELTYQIRSCVFEVYKRLGHGFLEKVYENALIKELQRSGLEVESQVPLDVFYKDDLVGSFIADLIVEEKVIVEIKAVEKLGKSAEAQLINYLKAGSMRIGLLINFTYPKATVKRFVF